jgi:hypothetical protein
MEKVHPDAQPCARGQHTNICRFSIRISALHVCVAVSLPLGWKLGSSDTVAELIFVS